jgi:ankyrin repeat protein
MDTKTPKLNPNSPPFVPRLSIIASLPPPAPPPAPPPPDSLDVHNGVVRLSLTSKKDVTRSSTSDLDVNSHNKETPLDQASGLAQRKEKSLPIRLPFRTFAAETPSRRLETLVQRVQNGRRQIEIDKRSAPFSNNEVNPDQGITKRSSEDGLPYYLYSYSSSLSSSLQNPTSNEFMSIETRSALVSEASALNDVVKLEEYSRTWSREEWGSALVSRNKRGDTPLLSSCRHGADGSAEFLINKGADVRAKTSLGVKCSPIHFAVCRGSSSLLRTLINNGADVNARDSNRRTPLHYASSVIGMTHIECMEMLLHAGCDINAMDEDGITSLLYAAACTNLGGVRLLIAQGAGVVTKIESLLRTSGCAFEVPGGALSPIHNLCESAQYKAVRSILHCIESSFASVPNEEEEEGEGETKENERNESDSHNDYKDDVDGNDAANYRLNIHAVLASRQGSPFNDDTVLHSAIRSKSLVMVQTILQFARRSLCLHHIIELRNGSGYTPLQLACTENRNDASMRSILASLVSTGSWITNNTISPIAELSPPPLVTAVSRSTPKNSRLSIVTVLVEKGGACLEPANPVDAPLLRVTPPAPLALAIASGDLDVAAYLLSAGSTFSTNALHALSKLTRRRETLTHNTQFSSKSIGGHNNRSGVPISPLPFDSPDGGQLNQDSTFQDEKVEAINITDLSYLLTSRIGADVRISPIEQSETGWQSSSSVISLFDVVLSTNSSQNKQPTGFELLVQKSTFAYDATTEITLSSKTFNLHAEILSLRSPYLQTLLLGSGAEATSFRDHVASHSDQACVVELHVPSIDAFWLVITYLYTGRLNPGRSRAISALWTGVSQAVSTDESINDDAHVSQIELRAFPEMVVYFDAALLAHKFDIPDLLNALEEKLLECAQGAALIEIGQELLRLTSSEIGSRLIVTGESELDSKDNDVVIALSPIYTPRDSSNRSRGEIYNNNKKCVATNVFTNLRRKTPMQAFAEMEFSYQLNENLYDDNHVIDNEGYYDIALSIYNALGLFDFITLYCTHLEAPRHSVAVAKRISWIAQCLCSLNKTLITSVIKFIDDVSRGSDQLLTSPGDLFRIMRRFESTYMTRLKSSLYDEDDKGDKKCFPIVSRDVIPFALFVVAIKELRFERPASALWRCAQRELKTPLFLRPPNACLSVKYYSLETSFSCRFPSPFIIPYERLLSNHSLDINNSTCSVSLNQSVVTSNFIADALRKVVKFICGDVWAIFVSTDWPQIHQEKCTESTMPMMATLNKTTNNVCIHCLQEINPPLITSFLVLLTLSRTWRLDSLSSTVARHLCKYADNIVEELPSLTIEKTLTYVTSLSTILVNVSDQVDLRTSSSLSSSFFLVASSTQIALLRVLSNCIKLEMKKAIFQLHIPASLMKDYPMDKDLVSSPSPTSSSSSSSYSSKICFVTIQATYKVILHIIGCVMRL